MHFFAPASIALCGLSAVTTVLATSHHAAESSLKKRHTAHVGDLVSLGNRSEIRLAERAGNNKFTYYEVGLGACGKVNNDGENVVALNHAQFDSEDFCFKTIIVTYQGKSIPAEIVDKCMGCEYGEIDLSPSLFTQFAPTGAGTIYGSWELATGAPSSPTPEPKPTTTKERPTPTPTPEPTTTSSKSKTNTTETPTSSAKETSSVASSATALVAPSSSPVTTPFATPTGIFEQFFLAYQQVAGLATAASFKDAS